jgi:hypothetical protein
LELWWSEMKGVKSEVVVVVVAMEAIAVGIGETRERERERLCSSLLVRILWILYFYFVGQVNILWDLLSAHPVALFLSSLNIIVQKLITRNYFYFASKKKLFLLFFEA